MKNLVEDQYNVYISGDIDIYSREFNDINFTNKDVVFLNDFRNFDRIIEIINYIQVRYEDVNFVIHDQYKNKVNFEEQIKNFLNKSNKLVNSSNVFFPVLNTNTILKKEENDYRRLLFLSIQELESIFRFIDNFSKDVEKKQMSNFEIIMYIYSFVTKFKKYKKGNKRLMNSIYGVLTSDYIACGGYCDVFKRLLFDVGIESKVIRVFTGNSDNVYHARILVNIDDDKYNIHGIYQFDPTVDSNTYYDNIEEANRQNVGEFLDLVPLYSSLYAFALNFDESKKNLKLDMSYIPRIIPNDKKIDLDAILEKDRINEEKIIRCLYNIIRYVFKNKLDKDDIIDMCYFILQERYEKFGKIFDCDIQKEYLLIRKKLMKTIMIEEKNIMKTALRNRDISELVNNVKKIFNDNNFYYYDNQKLEIKKKK